MEKNFLTVKEIKEVGSTTIQLEDDDGTEQQYIPPQIIKQQQNFVASIQEEVKEEIPVVRQSRFNRGDEVVAYKLKKEQIFEETLIVYDIMFNGLILCYCGEMATDQGDKGLFKPFNEADLMLKKDMAKPTLPTLPFGGKKF